MKYTRIYHENLDAYLSDYPLIINQGGQGSGKTYSILQLIAQIALLSKKKKHIVIASYALPHLKGGAMKVFDEILEAMNVNVGAVKNKSEHTYYINNARVEFFGIEGNEARAHSLRPDILYVNECNRRISWEVFKQFFSRVQQSTFIDFNPSAEFWLNDHIFGTDISYKIIKSTYKDNPYIAKNEFEFIDSRKDKPEWANWYRVYGLGEFGQLEDTILKYDFGQFDETLPYIYGLDFGYRDQDALVRVAIDHKQQIIYAEEKLFESGNSTEMLFRKLVLHTEPNKLIVADSASARTVYDLRVRGMNVVAVEKMRKVEILKKMQQYKLIITEDSYNLARELNGYIWLDKKSETPKDGDDHLIDALIYACTKLIGRPYKGIRAL